MSMTSSMSMTYTNPSPDHSLTVVHRGYGLRRVCGELWGGCRRDRAGDRGWVGPFAGGGDAVGGHAGAGCVARGCGVLGVGGRPRSARGGWERFEAAEGGDELAGPGPGALEVQLASAGGERQPGGDVQQPVAQPLGLGLLKLAVE